VTGRNWVERDGIGGKGKGSSFVVISREKRAKFAFRIGLLGDYDEGLRPGRYALRPYSVQPVAMLGFSGVHVVHRHTEPGRNVRARRGGRPVVRRRALRAPVDLRR